MLDRPRLILSTSAIVIIIIIIVKHFSLKFYFRVYSYNHYQIIRIISQICNWQHYTHQLWDLIQAWTWMLLATCEEIFTLETVACIIQCSLPNQFSLDCGCYIDRCCIDRCGIDRVLTNHRAQHTGRPELWLSVKTEIYGWAESAWRRNESDILKKIKR